ncbi:MAG TPA: tetratricopeptide repeat protein [Gemmataceae bacterium]|nr:tetratricopeptide repeat protein [Gemmataceae bacterium]
MADDTIGASLAALFQAARWADARKLLEAELVKDPDNHWLLTQLGVTYHEEQRYQEAIELFDAARRLMPDCPLVLWNLASTLYALRKHDRAVKTYTRLLESAIEPGIDVCWDSPEWGAALKADCVYRLGQCFLNQHKKEKAEDCFRQYLNLLLSGIEGSYSLQDVSREIRGLHEPNSENTAAGLRRAIRAALRTADTKSKNGTTRTAASKKTRRLKSKK